MKVKGIEIKKWQFNGKEGYNYYFYFLKDSNENIVGEAFDVEKVKVDLVNDFLVKNNMDLKVLLGKNVNFNYNKFGQVQSIEVL